MRFGRNRYSAAKDPAGWMEPLVVNAADFDLTDTDGLLLLAEQLGLSDAPPAPANSSLPTLPQDLDFATSNSPAIPS